MNSLKRKVSEEPIVTKRAKSYTRDSFDRFGDDLCALLLNYLDINDKIGFECVSKQWQRCVFHRETSLQINKYKSLKLDHTDLRTYPRLLPKLGQNFRRIQKFEFSLILLDVFAFHLMSYFPYLKEVGLTGYRPDDMQKFTALYGQFSYKVMKFHFRIPFIVNSLQTFNLFAHYYFDKTTTIGFNFMKDNKFDEVFSKKCLKIVSYFRMIKYLKIESPVDNKDFELFEDIKYIVLTNVKNKYVSNLLKTKNKIILFSTAVNMDPRTTIIVGFTSLRTVLNKMAKEGYFHLNSNLIDLNNFIYVPNSKLLIMALIGNFSVFNHGIFNNVKYLVITAIGNNFNEFMRMLAKNTSITHLCIQENDITQELIDLFKQKSEHTYHCIGILSSIKPLKYIVTRNYHVFLDERYMLFDKIMN